MQLYDRVVGFGKRMMQVGGLCAILAGCSESAPRPNLSADFNNDQRQDRLSCVNGSYRNVCHDVLVLLGNPDGTYSEPHKVMSRKNFLVDIGVADGDNDKILDIIFVEGYVPAFEIVSGDVFIAPGNGDGTFQQPRPFGQNLR